MKNARLYIGSDECDIDPKAEVALTITANDPESPSTLDSSYTNTFLIPWTRNNVVRVGGFLMAGDGTADNGGSQYLQRDAKLRIAEAIELKGKVLIFEGDQKAASAAFVAGVSDLLLELGDYTLQNLYLQGDHPRTHEDVAANINRDYTDFYTWAFCYHRTVDVPTSEDHLEDRFMFPFPYIWKVLQDVCSFAGWTCKTTGLLEDAFFRKVAIGWSGTRYQPDWLFSYYLRSFRLTAGAAPGQWVQVNEQDVLPGPIAIDWTPIVSNPRFDGVRSSGTCGTYFVREDDRGGKMFQFFSPYEIETDGGDYDWELRILAKNSNTQLAYYASGLITGGPPVVSGLTVNLLSEWVDIVDDEIVVQMRVNVALEVRLFSGYYRFCDSQDREALDFQSAEVGPTPDLIFDPLDEQNFYPYAVLPPMKMVDFIKYVCNSFGALPKVDSFLKEVEFVPFDAAATDYANGRDWSGIVDASKQIKKEWKYGGYARLNLLKYEDSDDEIPEGFGSASFAIDSALLTAEYEWLKLPFSGSLAREIDDGAVIITEVPCYNFEIVTGYFRGKPQELKPRIFYLETEDEVPLGIQDAEFGPIETVNEYKVARFTFSVDTQDLSGNSLIQNFHAEFIRMVSRMEKLTASFALKAADVANINLFSPIYLNGRYGRVELNGWYLIREIKEWRGQGTCEVELIKLNPYG